MFADVGALYDRLRCSLAGMIDEHGLAGNALQVRCRVLEAAEAIGSPEHRDYPILQGREHMVEALFEGARGQAFGDEFENCSGPVERLLGMNVDTNARRAVFVAGFNSVSRHCGRCAATVHCRDEEPIECARRLHDIFPAGARVLVVGLQPRFLEELAATNPVRAVDLDPGNIGTWRCGVEIEPAEATEEAINWCDGILVTGSTLVNGSIVKFLGLEKRVVFFGVTIAGAASVLGLDTFCHAPVR